MKIDYEYLFNDPNEKPLDRLVTDGGYSRIFRTIACVGDSLSSGEFESMNPDGSHGYYDMFEFSWGQFIARTTGAKVYNFSRGGMSATPYLKDFAESMGYWDPEKAAQAYIIAMACNDLNPATQREFGSIADVDFDDWHKTNIDTYAGSYACMIQRYKEIQPRAKFFLLTMPKGAPDPVDDATRQKQRALMYELAEKFDNTYVIDLYEYGPVYDEEFQEKFYMLGHLNPMGYAFTADIVMSYIDYIIRHNMEDFKQIGFIGTDLHP